MATINVDDLHPVSFETPLTKLTLSEQKGVHGGFWGLLFFAALAGASFLSSGCNSCTAHGRASKKPPKYPRKNSLSTGKKGRSK